MLSSVEHQSLSGVVADRLRQAIFNGHFEPGDRLSDAQIAAQLEVSRTPVREAIRILVAEGLLTEFPRRGVRLRTFAGQDVREICELRLSLESLAASRLAEDPSEENIALLRGLVEEMRGLGREESVRLSAVDTEFHMMLCALCGNGRLAELYRPLSLQVRLLQMLDNRFCPYDGPDEAAERHALVLAPIERGDPAAAREAVREHIEWAERSLREVVLKSKEG